MQLHIFPVEDISVSKQRQRRVFDPQQIQELAGSIAENGLIHPLVVRKTDEGLILVAGERRLKALDIVWNFGQEVRCGTKVIPEGQVPCLFLGEIDPIDAFEIELEENIRRTDLDWRDKVQATNKLFELRAQQAKLAGKPAPSVADLAREVHPDATAGLADGQLGDYQAFLREDILLARNIQNPVVASAPSRKEALKALKRDEESKRNAELGRIVGATFSSSLHSLRQGDCLEILPTLQEQFDVICTDPPYGISADEYGDSGGKTPGAHFYDDSQETWIKLMSALSLEGFRVTKPQAHAYVFCDIDRFAALKDFFSAAGWKVFRTPLIWINQTAMRTPWPDQGPQRKWQMILYAVKGQKQCTRIYPDVLIYPSDPNLGHNAQKPVGLYCDLLRRSVKPGDSVLDPFAGTGTIYPAAHQFKCRATGIEADAAACGIAAKRLKELK